MAIDAQATPLMAREVIRRIRKVTSKPIRHVVLTHYHAVRVLGASAYRRNTREDAQIAQAGLCIGAPADGPEIRPLSDLRALHAVRRLARLRRGARHQAPAHLDRATRRGDVEGDRLKK